MNIQGRLYVPVEDLADPKVTNVRVKGNMDSRNTKSKLHNTL
jgi:hypothetical protein